MNALPELRTRAPRTITKTVVINFNGFAVQDNRSLVTAGLIDMRLPLTFSLDDAALIARIIRAEALAVGQGPEPEAAELPVIQ